MPQGHALRLEQVIQQIVDQVDHRQPYARQLEQVAAASVECGLRKALVWRSLSSTVAPGLRVKIDDAVARFVAPQKQDILDKACGQAGVQQVDVLASMIVNHCQKDVAPLTAEQVARYGLAFGQALMKAKPALAKQYRQWMRACRPELHPAARGAATDTG